MEYRFSIGPHISRTTYSYPVWLTDLASGPDSRRIGGWAFSPAAAII